MPRPFAEEDLDEEDTAAVDIFVAEREGSFVAGVYLAKLLASRFWPARRFRTTPLRLYRSMP